MGEYKENRKEELTKEVLKDRVMEIPNRGDWKILGFIEEKGDDEKGVILKSLVIKNQREVVSFSELRRNLEDGIWKIIN